MSKRLIDEHYTMVGSGNAVCGGHVFWQRCNPGCGLDYGCYRYIFRNDKRMNMSFSKIQKGERWAYIKWRIAQVWRRMQGRS